MRRFVLLLVSASAFLQSCASRTGLEEWNDYIREQDFEPFTPPRDNAGAGTIIRFEGGREIIVRMPGECLAPGADVIKSETQLTSLESGESSRYSIETAVMKELAEVDISAALAGSGVQGVKIEIKDPFIYTMSEGSIRDAVRAMEENSPCRQDASAVGHFVINRVLGASGIDYSFFAKDGSQLQVTAEMTEQLGLDAESTAASIGNYTLKSDKELLLGYNIVRVRPASGAADSGMQVDKVGREVVAKLKSDD